jgi:hypothetical protein
MIKAGVPLIGLGRAGIGLPVATSRNPIARLPYGCQRNLGIVGIQRLCSQAIDFVGAGGET